MSELYVDSITEQTSGNGVLIPGHVVQVVQKIDTATSTITNTGTAGTFTTCGSLSQSFTPKSSSSKVLLRASVFIAGNLADRLAFFKFAGGNTADGVADAAGSRTRALAVHYFQNAADATQVSFEYLDSPATSSAITYSVQIAPNFTNNNIYINYYSNDTDASYIPRACSTLTIMEIAQ